MKQKTRAIIVGILGSTAVTPLFALTVCPFQYGFNEALLLVGVLVGLALMETVLDEIST